ncbi:MAG TPA: addiction module protein [Tepidisphaeraceae bacterium]|nr:addiction module protein [Tepidisphaeraceae bacterium]
MTKSAQQILKQAMALDDEDRAELVDELLGTLEPRVDQEYVTAWEKEISSRIADFESGKAKGIPWEDVLKQLDERRRK